MGDSPTMDQEDVFREGSAPPSLTLRENMLWNSIGSLVFLGTQWLITILVVRLSHNYDAAGVLALATSVITIFAPIAEYKMYVYQVSDVRNENTAGEYMAFRLITSGIAFVALIAYSIVTTPPQTWGAIAIYALVKILSLLIDVLHATDQLNGRMDYIGISRILQGTSTLLAFTLIFYFSQSLELAFVGMAVATITVGLTYDVPHSRRFGRIRVSITLAKTRYLLIYCLPIVIAAISAAAAPSVPRQFLVIIEGKSALGIYASIAAPAAIIQMGAGYIYNPMMTIFASHYMRGERKEFLQLLGKTALAIAALGAVAALGLEVFGPWLLQTMFGASINPYFYLLHPIIALTIVSGFVWFLSSLLIAVRSFPGNLVGNLVALAIGAGAGYFFVDVWGMNGVSFVGILSYLVGGLVMIGYLLVALKNDQKHANPSAEEEYE